MMKNEFKPYYRLKRLGYQRDKFQVAAFKVHHKINIRAGMGNDMAFACAIAATSDTVTEKILDDEFTVISDWRRSCENGLSNGQG